MNKIIKIIPIMLRNTELGKKNEVLLALRSKKREGDFCWKNLGTLYEDSSILIRTWRMGEDREEVQTWDGRLKARQQREHNQKGKHR